MFKVSGSKYRSIQYVHRLFRYEYELLVVLSRFIHVIVNLIAFIQLQKLKCVDGSEGSYLESRYPETRGAFRRLFKRINLLLLTFPNGESRVREKGAYKYEHEA